jgi:hypothetical protein
MLIMFSILILFIKSIFNVLLFFPSLYFYKKRNHFSLKKIETTNEYLVDCDSN